MTLAAIERSTVPKPEDRLEWLRARVPYFNASSAGALYGVHPHQNLGDVATEKLTPVSDEGQTEAMERGVRLEPFLLDWFGDRHGVKVETPNLLYVAGRLMATIDGEPVGESDTWVEAKTTSHRWDTVPDHVYWQAVAQGAASGKSTCHVVWIDADMQFKEAIVVPAPAHMADVLERAERFMDFIDLGMVPEGVELSAENLTKMFPEPVAGKFADVDDAGLTAIVRWEQLRQDRLAAEKAEAEAKDEVARLIADAEGARHDGRLIATWRANKASERFIARAHEADAPECHAAFKRTVPGARVLRATRELGAA
jgi:hypothetical protein